MYDIITIALLFAVALSVYMLGYGVVLNNKRQIVGSLFSIAITIIISITAFYIDSNSSQQELLKKVEKMYSGHPRSYLSIPQQSDKVRRLNGWIIDYLAIEYLEKAIEMQPKYSNAKVKLCEMYIYKKRYNDVIKYANTISNENEENTRLLELEAVAYYKLGYKEIAYEKYNILKNKNAVSNDLFLLFKVSVPSVE